MLVTRGPGYPTRGRRVVSLGLHGHGVRVTSGEPCAGTKDVILGKSLLRSQDNITRTPVCHTLATRGG